MTEFAVVETAARVGAAAVIAAGSVAGFVVIAVVVAVELVAAAEVPTESDSDVFAELGSVGFETVIVLMVGEFELRFEFVVEHGVAVMAVMVAEAAAVAATAAMLVAPGTDVVADDAIVAVEENAEAGSDAAEG